MKLGETSLLTNDVCRLAGFYKKLLDVDNGSVDPVHQFILSGEVSLTVFNDGSLKNNCNQNMCIAFTVDDINREYQKLLSLGSEIIQPPARQPWGTINLSFYDPDRNIVYLRQFV